MLTFLHFIDSHCKAKFYWKSKTFEFETTSRNPRITYRHKVDLVRIQVNYYELCFCIRGVPSSGSYLYVCIVTIDPKISRRRSSRFEYSERKIVRELLFVQYRLPSKRRIRGQTTVDRGVFWLSTPPFFNRIYENLILFLF